MLKVVPSLHLQAWLLLTVAKAFLTSITRFPVEKRRGKRKDKASRLERHIPVNIGKVI